MPCTFMSTMYRVAKPTYSMKKKNTPIPEPRNFPADPNYFYALLHEVLKTFDYILLDYIKLISG